MFINEVEKKLPSNILAFWYNSNKHSNKNISETILLTNISKSILRWILTKERKDLHNKALRCWRYKLKKITEDETPSYVYGLVLSKSVYAQYNACQNYKSILHGNEKNLKIHKKAQNPRIFKTIPSNKATTTRIIILNSSYTNHL